MPRRKARSGLDHGLESGFDELGDGLGNQRDALLTRRASHAGWLGAQHGNLVEWPRRGNGTDGVECTRSLRTHMHAWVITATR
jgi:hypothetical protein